MPNLVHEVAGDAASFDAIADADTEIERLFDEDPRAGAAAKWIAERAAAALEEPKVLEPLIDLLLDRAIREPRFDVEVKRVGGTFSVRPIATKRLHKLADYETFQDLLDLPSGETSPDGQGSAVEYFWDFATRHARRLILDALKAAARKGLEAAHESVKCYLAELANRGALEEFAKTVFHDLTLEKEVDEHSLVDQLAAMSFPTVLLARRPDQAARFAKDRGRAERDRPDRRLTLKIPRLVDAVVRRLARRPESALAPDVAVLAAIVGEARNVEGLDNEGAADNLGPLRLVDLVARDERILLLLPKRGASLLQRNAARWLYEIAKGQRHFSHALVALYDDLDRSVRASASCTVSILQGGVTSIFGAANWPFFLAYALGPGDPRLDDKFEIVITRAESHPVAFNASPLEAAAGVLIDGGQTSYLTAEDFQQGHGANLTPLTPGSRFRLADADEAVFQSL